MSFKEVQTLVAAAKIDNPLQESLEFISYLTALPKAQILADNFQLSQRHKAEIKQLIKLRQQMPLAYIKKRVEFYGLSFKINQQTFIPRPESEDMIDLALKLPQNFNHVYDLGCGSGCLGVSYLQSKPKPATFIDKNPWALSLSRLNAQKHGIESANFLLADFKHLKPTDFIAESLFLANLPYLDLAQKAAYEKNCPTLASEPADALYAEGGGLKLYEALFARAPDSATLLCESLPQQQKALQKLARQSGWQLLQSLNYISLFIK